MTIRFTNRTDLLMATLTAFYREPGHLQQLLRVVGGKSHISLRLIDWFITNYSKTRGTMYQLESVTRGEVRTVEFVVHQAYKSALKAFSKKAFDPFCRGPNIEFHYDRSNFIVTTPGQLNLVKWLITNRVLDYIEAHLTEIEEAAAEEDVAKKGKVERPLSVSATRTVTKHHVKLTVSFN